MSRELTTRLESCYSGAIYDVLRAMGRSECVLPSTIRPLDPARKLCGPVFTMSGHLEPGIDEHESLLRWTAFLAAARPGSVVVCQPNDSTLSHMGELSAETLQFRGVRGYIVDGGCRDSDFILQIGFPVFCRYYTPRDIVGRWVAEGFDSSIKIGEVTVNSADYVLADRDGVVVIPGDLMEEVVTRTEEVMQTENLVRKAILLGVDPQEAYLKYGKF